MRVEVMVTKSRYMYCLDVVVMYRCIVETMSDRFQHPIISRVCTAHLEHEAGYTHHDEC